MKPYVEAQIAKLNEKMAKAAAWKDAPNRDDYLSRIAGHMRRLNNLAWNSER